MIPIFIIFFHFFIEERKKDQRMTPIITTKLTHSLEDKLTYNLLLARNMNLLGITYTSCINVMGIPFFYVHYSPTYILYKLVLFV